MPIAHRICGEATRVERTSAPKTGQLGASLVEYALLIALIAVVCFAAVSFAGKQTGDKLDKSAECIKQEIACP